MPNQEQIASLEDRTPALKHRIAELQTARKALEAEADDRIVTHNFNILGDDVIKVASTESMGGNAGTAIIDGREWVCQAVNFYINRDTGEIEVVGNTQELKSEEQSIFKGPDIVSGTLRLAAYSNEVKIDHTNIHSRLQVAGVFAETRDKNGDRESLQEVISKRAWKNLNMAVERNNEIARSDIKPL